jgi:DNA-binding NtrC family response regulator
LRERPSDIAALAEHFLELAGSATASDNQLTPAAIEKLALYDWPGNVRELRNVIERACVLTRSGIIDAGDLDIGSGQERSLGGSSLLEADLPSAVAKLEETMIRKALEASGGKRTEAARRLNINRQLLYAKMQRYRLADGEVSGKRTPSVGKDDT